MVQTLRCLSVVAVLSLCVQTQAADPFRATGQSSVPHSSLEAMGLGGMATLSQQQSTQIRGQGAVVWGKSYASSRTRYQHAHSSNGYHAYGRNGAVGKNLSIAATAKVRRGTITGGVAAAGGFSYARGF